MNLKEMLLSLNMLMFGGKGGVGKTTCAASAAIWAADQGRNTLIISTDPAHSLGDSLGITLKPGEPTKIPSVQNLTALEIDPKQNLEQYSHLLNVSSLNDMQIPGMGDNFPIMEDLQDLTAMNPPGIDEAFALLKVLEFLETEHDYDLVIFDTAPTGHTLRFLSLPETLSSWIGKLLKIRMKLGGVFSFFKRLFTSEEKEEDTSLEVLERLNKSIINAREDLTNPLFNSFIIVMISEEMAITETGRLINELVKFDIPVSNIIVNQLYLEEKELCDFCKARRSMQQRNLKKILEIFKNKLGKNVIEIPLFREEVREVVKLKEFSKYFFQ
jgi:arsenite-transporting ATPase